MTNKSFQKIIIFLLLTSLIIGSFGQIEAATRDDIESKTPSWIKDYGLPTLIVWYTARCSIAGRISGMDEIPKWLEDQLKKVLDAFADKFLGWAKDPAGTATKKLEEALSGAVPVRVEGLEVLESQMALTAAQVQQGDICDYANRILNNVIRQQILDKATNDIIKWIKGGYKGKVFVSDWGNFLESAGWEAVNQMVGGAIENSDLKFLCTPFGFQVHLTLLPVPDFASKERTGCTLDTIEENIDRFYEDFRNGGWVSYQEHWQPQNNFYGATLIGWSESSRRATLAQQAAQNEALAGGGFLPQKDETGKITTPGSLIGDAAGQVLEASFGGILSAEELSDYIAAIINTAINQLITDSIDDLKNLNR